MKAKPKNPEVRYSNIEPRPRPKRAKPPKVYIPNAARAVCNGYIATILNGRRIVAFYTSGQPLKGKIEA